MEHTEPRCGQCGEPYTAKACGPTHALLHHEKQADLSPAVMVFMDVLAERDRQDQIHGRTGHSFRVWQHKLQEWQLKMSAAELAGDVPEMRRRLIQVMAIALAMLELGIDGPLVDEQQPAPGVDFEEDEDGFQPLSEIPQADFEGPSAACTCLPPDCPDDECPVHGRTHEGASAR